MRSRKGITLIALVITIVVILILAGISINAIVNGDFFGKANTVKTDYASSVNQAEADENKALEQNKQDFKVDDEYTVSDIQLWGYFKVEEKNEDGTIKNTTYNLRQIDLEDISLSQFIDENIDSDHPYIYFWADSKKENVDYIVKKSDDGDISVVKVKQENNNTFSETSEKTKYARINASDIKENLDGLKIQAVNSLNDPYYSLNFYHIKNENIKNVATIIPENASNDMKESQYITMDYVINNDSNPLDYDKKSELKFTNTNTESGQEYGISKIEDNNITFTGYDSSVVERSGEGIKVYSVLENKENTERDIVLYDSKVQFYNPIIEVSVDTKTIPFLANDKEIQYTCKSGKSANGEEAKVDFSTNNAVLVELSEKSYDPNNYFECKIEKTEAQDNPYTVKISSKKSEDDYIDLYALEAGGYTFQIKITAYDYAGNSCQGEATIRPTINNFEIEKDTNVVYKATLEEALEQAEIFGEGTTIIQLIDEYTQDTDVTIETNNLTYDMNGNTLTFANDKHITINEGITFNLVSSNDNKPNDRGCYKYNGNISFNHDTTFKNESVIKYISNEDFLSKYPQFKNVGTYLESGAIPGKTNTLWNRIKYTGLFTTRKIEAYKEYIHSFNAIGFNVNYKQEISGLINHGTLNFKSGKIVVNTYERVMAIGAFGGGAVLNISNTFLDILRALGVEVADLTDLTGSYSQLENTATGIENYGTVNLGEGSGIQNGDSESANHPEIEINVISKEHAYGVSVGNIRHPNKVISRAYGVWNKDNGTPEGPTTIMNSGFMTSFLTNNTNSWWSAVSVGKAYGIYNEKGKATINGITKKTVNRGSISIYNIIVDKIFRDYEDENSNVLQKNLEEIDKWWEKTVEQKTFYGFFTHSNLQLVSKLTGATYYTNSYAVGYPENGSSNGITMKQDIVNKVNDATKGNSDGYKGYSNNTYQSVQNFVNYYLNFKTINGNVFSNVYEKINNVLNTDWVGEDFNANNILDGAIKKIFNLIK